MEQKILGLVEEEIRLVKKDEELALSIIKSRGWGNNQDKINYVYSCLRYNMFTVLQFAELSGIKESVLHNYYLSPSYNKESQLVTRLDHCFPFKSADKNGPKFIMRNEKSLKILNRE